MAGPFGYISLANALSWCLPAQGMRTKGPGAPGKEGSDEEDGLLGYVLKAGWKVPLEGKSKAWVLCSPTPTSSAFQELTHLPPPPAAFPAVIAVWGAGGSPRQHAPVAHGPGSLREGGRAGKHVHSALAASDTPAPLLQPRTLSWRPASPADAPCESHT